MTSKMLLLYQTRRLENRNLWCFSCVLFNQKFNWYWILFFPTYNLFPVFLINMRIYRKHLLQNCVTDLDSWREIIIFKSLFGANVIFRGRRGRSEICVKPYHYSTKLSLLSVRKTICVGSDSRICRILSYREL